MIFVSNADTLSTGGVNSVVGPVLMRKVAPLAVQTQDISVPELAIYKDSLFSSVAGRLQNISFHLGDSARLPEVSERSRMVAAQLGELTKEKNSESSF